MRANCTYEVPVAFLGLGYIKVYHSSVNLEAFLEALITSHFLLLRNCLPKTILEISEDYGKKTLTYG